MGGIVGRLFREFAVTLSMAILVSMVISLTTTPMMCAALLRNPKSERHGRLYRWSERAFDAVLAGYRRHAQGRSAASASDARGDPRHDGGDDPALRQCPQGILPAAGHGAADRLDPGRPEHLLPGDGPPADRVRGDPPEGPGHRLRPGVRRRQQHHEHGADVHHAQAPRGTQGVVRRDHQPPPAEARPRARRDALHAVGSGPANRRAPQRGAVPVHAARRGRPRAAGVGPADPAAHPQAPGPRSTSTATSRSRASRRPSRSTGPRPRAWASRRRRSTTRSTTRSASGRSRRCTRRSTSTTSCSRWIRSSSNGRRASTSYASARATDRSCRSRRSRATRPSTAPLQINHQGQFPSVTLSFNLKPGMALGDAVEAIQKVESQARLPATIRGSFQGTAQAFQDSLRQPADPDPRRALRRLHRARDPLREPDPPDHDPLDAAVRRRRRAPRPHALQGGPLA